MTDDLAEGADVPGPDDADAGGEVSAQPGQSEDAPDAEGAEGDLLDDQADAAEDFLNGLLDVLDMDGEAQAEIEDDLILVDLDGPDLGVLIGRHGATLDALQELTRAAVQHQTTSRARLVLDIGGYRERHREILERRARQVAAKVRKDRKPHPLEPMSAMDRKIVHNALAGFEGVMTSSEGEDAERHIVIKPT